jgi:Tol biopolymer transport system component
VLLWTEVGDPTTVGDIWALSPHENARPISLRRTVFDEFEPTFSPDGRFIAYVSNDSGTYEIYVQTYSGPYRRFRPEGALIPYGLKTDTSSFTSWVTR